MATSADIKWSAYRSFEGPFYLGKCRYVLPEVSTENERFIAVITATEGGRFDAINMYDRCIISSGLVQWCEASQYSVSDMLGHLGPHLLGKLREFAPRPFEFKKNEKGRFRFFTEDMGEVDTLQEQQLFFLSCDGLKGSWTPEAKKEYAKSWAAAVATVWENPEAQKVQVDYTAKRLTGFILPEARKVYDAAPPTGVGRAFRAAYLSFAANNPTWANSSLRKGLETTKEAWTLPWLEDVLRALTFASGVTIYPQRYNAIRPLLERLYGVNLPDFATELGIVERLGGPIATIDTKDLQEALIFLGFDLGPTGADGAYGGKTKDAVLSFEQLDYGEPDELKVPPAEQNGMVDHFTAPKLQWVLEKRSYEKLA